MIQPLSSVSDISAAILLNTSSPTPLKFIVSALYAVVRATISEKTETAIEFCKLYFSSSIFKHTFPTTLKVIVLAF